MKISLFLLSGYLCCFSFVCSMERQNHLALHGKRQGVPFAAEIAVQVVIEAEQLKKTQQIIEKRGCSKKKQRC